MLKIGITGSNNTGKTTLAYFLHLDVKKYTNFRKVSVAQESVRECPLGTKARATIEAQTWILLRQMQIELVHSAHADMVIADKTALDTLCYGEWAYQRQLDSLNRKGAPSAQASWQKEEIGARMRNLESLASTWLPTYDLIVYVPVREDIPSHNWFPERDQRAEIDALIQGHLNPIRHRVLELPPETTVEQRVDLLLRRLPGVVAPGRPLRFYSCFISYSHDDRAFAQRLHELLQAHGIRSWLDVHDLHIGERIQSKVLQAIEKHERLILCCSRASLSSSWVEAEIEEALSKEKKHKCDIILPLDLDHYLFDEWRGPLAVEVRKRLAADFNGWDQNDLRFAETVERLVEALRADRPAD